MLSYRHHIIKNFHKEKSWIKKILFNIIFLIVVTKIFQRKNFLRKKDFKRSRKVIQPGDLVLVAGHTRIMSLVTHDFVSHSLLYVGNKKLVHSIADGVQEMKFVKLFKEYDTLMILRPKNITQSQVTKSIDFVSKQLGKPYDFEFVPGEKEFFCTQLINDAYKHSGFKTGVSNFIKNSAGMRMPLKAKGFLKGNFKVIFYSNSLEKKSVKSGKRGKDGKPEKAERYVLKHKVYQNKIFEKIIN